jgi:2'-5' RNA ligase
MDESALIVAVPEAEALVSRFRDKYDPSAAVGVPAHVTLLYPFLRPDAIDAGVVAALAKIFASARPCDVVFERCGRFEPKTLWLAPEPAAPFLDLTRRLVARWPQCPPYLGTIALEDVVPHLTVADSITGDLLDRIEMAVAGGLPVRTRLAEATLIVSETGRWTTRGTFPIGG